MKTSTCINTAGLALITLASTVTAATPVQQNIPRDGLLIDLEHLRPAPAAVIDASSFEGGLLIPLSYEMFDTPTPETTAAAVVDAQTTDDSLAKVLAKEVVFSEVKVEKQPAAPHLPTVTNKLPVASVPADSSTAQPPQVTPEVIETSQPLVQSTPVIKQPAVEKATPVVKPTVAVKKAPVENPAPPATPEVKLPVKLVEAVAAEEAAEEDSADAAFEAIVDAMTPKEPVSSLDSKRFTLYLSDKVAFAQFEVSTAKFNLDRGRVHLATIYSEERDSLVQTGITLDAAFAKSYRLSFGTRAYIALLSEENVDAFFMAIGAETAYRLPFEAVPLEFSASLYYAPDILTFGAGDRAMDAQVDVTLPFREKSALFAGIRFLQVDVRPEDREVDNRVHLGFRWDFD